jgi:SAM-dependent methyltransferase
VSDKTWEAHWATSHVPWDAGEPAPGLQDFLSRLTARIFPLPRGRALVPGCGSGYDAFALARAGFRAVGVDIAPSVASRFSSMRESAGLTQEEADLVVGDFFSLTPKQLGGTFDMMWDYTFYCAIDPSLRPKWKGQVRQLLRPGGTLAMLIFPVEPEAPPEVGPPYPLDPEQVVQSLQPEFELISLEPARLSHPGREGREWLAVLQL